MYSNRSGLGSFCSIFYPKYHFITTPYFYENQFTPHHPLPFPHHSFLLLFRLLISPYFMTTKMNNGQLRKDFKKEYNNHINCLEEYTNVHTYGIIWQTFID